MYCPEIYSRPCSKRATSSLRPSAVTASGAIGAPAIREILAHNSHGKLRRDRPLPRANKLSASPRRAIGITGTGLRRTMRSISGRKTLITPSLVIRPSGKTHSRCPFSRLSAIRSKVRSSSSGSSFLLAIGIAPRKISHLHYAGITPFDQNLLRDKTSRCL